MSYRRLSVTTAVIALAGLTGLTLLAAGCTPSGSPSAQDSASTTAGDWQPVPYESVTLSQDQLDEIRELRDQGDDLYDDEDFAGCAEKYAAALAIYDGNDSNHYNHACCLALGGEPEAALVALEKAVASGWWSTASFEADDDLASVRELPGYADLIERVEALKTAYAQNDPLAPTQTSENAASAESFDSLEKLEEHFSDLQAELREPELRALGSQARRDRRWQIAGQHIAALHRFAETRPSTQADTGSASTVADSPARAADQAEMWALDIYAGLDPTPAGLDRQITQFLDRHAGTSLVDHAEIKRVIQPWGWSDLIWDTEAEGREEKWAEVLAVAQAIEADGPTDLGARDANLFLLFDAQERNDHQNIGAYYRRLDQYWGDDARFWQDHGYQLNAARLIANGVPEFEIETIDEARWTRESLAGKVTLIDFWGTWCGPCIAEIPHLKKLYAERHEQGFEILGISAEDGEDMDLDSFKSWLEEREMTWPQHYDGLMRESEIIKLFEIRGYPTTILVDREGQIVAVNLRGEELAAKVGEII